jgi:hypothetical protein
MRSTGVSAHEVPGGQTEKIMAPKMVKKMETLNLGTDFPLTLGMADKIRLLTPAQALNTSGRKASFEKEGELARGAFLQVTKSLTKFFAFVGTDLAKFSFSAARHTLLPLLDLY